MHLIVGYAFYTGLARRIAQTIIPPVEIAQIDKPKADDKPPPPPPKLEDIKPYVPPPEFVDIEAPNAITNAITQTTQVRAPAPPPVQVQHTRTGVKPDARHPLHIGEDYYPDASKRANEEGTCRVRITVAADGRITDASIESSSGFPRLDDACLKGVKGQRLIPAMEDGKPVETTTIVPITWKLKN
ncbi:MAG: energy transducer TonB [Steroidobacterales bacterium]